mgnify:CR=1 FL=1
MSEFPRCCGNPHGCVETGQDRGGLELGRRKKEGRIPSALVAPVMTPNNTLLNSKHGNRSREGGREGGRETAHEFNTIVSLNTREFTKIKIDGSLNIDLVSSLANNHFISRILKRNYFTLWPRRMCINVFGTMKATFDTTNISSYNMCVAYDNI